MNFFNNDFDKIRIKFTQFSELTLKNKFQKFNLNKFKISKITKTQKKSLYCFCNKNFVQK